LTWIKKNSGIESCFYTDEKENKEKRENSICNDNEPVTTALLLAAGTGSRLYPLTQDMPKCLTAVNEVPILERLVDCLNQQGFKRLVVVTGHLENRIQEFLGNRAGDMIIEYIHSPLYKTTNNIYSLWMAREFINEPFLLIESDLVFHASLLDELLYPDRIAVSRMQPWMNGSTVMLDQFDRLMLFITAYRILRMRLDIKLLIFTVFHFLPGMALVKDLISTFPPAE
jgi:GTP:adenosylcobinamide-phosphate guanylyltransferase